MSEEKKLREIKLELDLIHNHYSERYSENCEVCSNVISNSCYTNLDINTYKNHPFHLKLIADVYSGYRFSAVKEEIQLENSNSSFRIGRNYYFYYDIKVKNVKNCRMTFNENPIFSGEAYYCNNPFENLLPQEKLALISLRKDVKFPKEIVSKIKGYLNTEHRFPFTKSSPLPRVSLAYSEVLLKYEPEEDKTPELSMVSVIANTEFRNNILRNPQDYKLVLKDKSYRFNSAGIF